MKENELQEIRDLCPYPFEVLEGKIIACELVKLACQRFINFLQREEMYFDLEDVKRKIRITESLKHFKGEYAGSNFILEPFQKFVYCAVYGIKWKKNKHRVTRTVILSMGRKGGKAIDINTPVPTPQGFKPMKDIMVGDDVYDENGRPTKVIATTDIMYNHNCYKLTFGDNTNIIADAGHQWFVKDRELERHHKDRSEYVITTEDLAQSRIGHMRKDQKGMEYRFRIPMAKPLEGIHKELPLDPYVLGVWLADGSKGKPEITEDIREPFIIDKVSQRIGMYSSCRQKKNSFGTTYYFRDSTGLKPKLKQLGIYTDKRIPRIYMEASVSQRLELLQGLMDADGYIDKRGYMEISQTKQDLALDILELIRSLGIKVSARLKTTKLNGKECLPTMRMNFFTDKTLPCFTLPRKYEKLKDNLNKRMLWKTITKIEEVESVPVKCIEVDSPNHLYLAGKECFVTHNSSLISAMAINALFEEASAQCIVAANSASQAGILFKMAQKYLKSLDPKNKYFRQYRDRIIFDKTSSEIRVVSADASRLDGLDCSFFVQDETAAAPSSEVWDVLEQSAGSRAQPLAVSCTTRGFNLSGFYKELEDSAIEVLKGVKEDDSLFTLIYTLDDGDDYEDPKVWKKCQPNLGVSVFPEFMEQQITKGKNTPTQQYSIMTKVFNCWQSSSENWIQMDYIWKSMQKFDLEQFRNEFCYVSFDLASVNDLTCLGCMIPYGDKFYIKLKYYLPHDSLKGNPNEERLKRWAKDGYLTVTEGNVTDYDYVIRDIDSIQVITPIIKIAYDQWNSQSTAIELTSKGLPLQPYSQSLQSMNLPTKTLENMILSGKIVFDKNPITAWCFENAKTKYDSLDNVRIIKNSYTQKIDGAITSIMLMGGYLTSEHYDCSIMGTTC